MEYKNLLYSLKGITPEEFNYLQRLMNGMTPEQAQNFIMFYSGKRQSPTDILLFTLIGFIAVAGVQRFMTRQIGMVYCIFLQAAFVLLGLSLMR